jgi:hypothetical protein
MSEPDDDKYLDDDKYIADYLETAKQEFEKGNKAALLQSVYQCCLLRKPLPEGLRLAFIEAYESAARFEARSWDEVFGKPQEEGAHLEARKLHAELRYDIALRVALRSPDEKIQPDLFDKIAEELNIEDVKGTTVSKIYYDRGGKELSEMLQPVSDFLKQQREEPKTAPGNTDNPNSAKI